MDRATKTTVGKLSERIRLSPKQWRLAQIVAGGALYAAAILIDAGAAKLSLYIAALAVLGGNIIYKALRGVLSGELFDENFLMSIAAIGAFAIGEHSEGVAVMLFYQVGELCQSWAVDRSRRSIAALMDIRPDYANVKRGGLIVQVDPSEVKAGELIVIKPGERVPIDAVVVEGSSMVDTVALTGESVPREVAVGDTILSGSINAGGLLVARTEKLFGESTASRILELVENSSEKKSRPERFITKFARWYTPVIVLLAALIATLPPLFIPGAGFSEWIYRALTFLVISCPCALVISVPLSFFGGIGGASRAGILVKGGNYLEALAKAETVVFDKTGTLTRGVFEVEKIVPAAGVTERELLDYAAHAEAYSTHPISQSLRKALGREPDSARVSEAREVPGCGVVAVVDGKSVAVGNAKLMAQLGIEHDPAPDNAGTVVYAALDGRFVGYIQIGDTVKADSAAAVTGLRKSGVKDIVMLTGDAEPVAKKVAAQLGIENVRAGLLPEEKVSAVEELICKNPRSGKLVFVGDGINDAPVLARADVGVAMGGLGSDAAIEAADVVIMNDEPSKLVSAIKISRKTMRVAKQNIAFSLCVKFAILLLGALGLASMWAAVFADVGVTLIAIFNSLRTMKLI